MIPCKIEGKVKYSPAFHQHLVFEVVFTDWNTELWMSWMFKDAHPTKCKPYGLCSLINPIHSTIHLIPLIFHAPGRKIRPNFNTQLGILSPFGVVNGNCTFWNQISSLPVHSSFKVWVAFYWTFWGGNFKEMVTLHLGSKLGTYWNRIIRYLTRPFHPSSTQLPATTNNGAAATTYFGGIQTTLARSLALTAIAMETMGT